MTRGSRVAAVALPLLAAPLAAEAQPASRIPRIAFLSTTSPGTSPTTDAFLHGLRELGYVEGQNITVEWRWGRGTTEHFPEFASDVVGLGVDLIVAANNPAGYAAQRVTHTIPIVISTMIDPVAVGFVASLARPGGNITGLTIWFPGFEGKRLQLLREALAPIHQVALLTDVNDPNLRSLVRGAESAARALGVKLQPRVDVRTLADLPEAFRTISRGHARAVLVVGGTVLYANRVQLIDQALKARLPMMCETRQHVETGCLMSYAARLPDLFRRAV